MISLVFSIFPVGKGTEILNFFPVSILINIISQ